MAAARDLVKEGDMADLAGFLGFLLAAAAAFAASGAYTVSLNSM